MIEITGQFILGILVNGISSIIGVLIAYLLREVYFKRKYAGWHIRVLQDSQQRVDRKISPGKSREIDEEPAELAVLLKGTASPYATLNCDILEEGIGSKLLIIDETAHKLVEQLPTFNIGKRVINHRVQRTYTIDLDKNPERNAARPTGFAPR